MLNAQQKIESDSIIVEKVEQGKWTATYYGNTYRTTRRTANGDVFDKNKLTCASMIHKFGTMLRVTNLANNKSVIVKVNDRGRFSKNSLDLSWGAFGQIAAHKTGRVNVKVEVINKVQKKIEKNKDVK